MKRAKWLLAATIMAGGMAERMKFHACLIYSFVSSAFVYPVVGHCILQD